MNNIYIIYIVLYLYLYYIYIHIPMYRWCSHDIAASFAMFQPSKWGVLVRPGRSQWSARDAGWFELDFTTVFLFSWTYYICLSLLLVLLLYIVLYCILFCYIVLYCTILYYNILYCYILVCRYKMIYKYVYNAISVGFNLPICSKLFWVM